MTRAPMAAGATCFVAIVMVLSALLSAPSRLGAQVLRNPETPYHFLRYDDVPSDQNSPYWPKDFWSPLKFIPLDIAILNLLGRHPFGLSFYPVAPMPRNGACPRANPPARAAVHARNRD